MQFTLVLAILAALVISENSPSQPVTSPGYRLATAVAGMMCVAAFAAISSGVIAGRLRRDFQRRGVLLRHFRHLRRAHAVLWLAVTAGIFCWLDWGQLVRFNWHLERAFLIDEVLIFLPVLLPMILSWAAFYQVDQAARAGPAEKSPLESQVSTRRHYLEVHLRHYFGIVLLPVLALLAVHDAADLLMPGIVDSEYAFALCVPPVVLLFVFFPALLRHVWQTRPLGPGPLRDRLEAAAQRAGFRAREILVWHTHGMIVNAAIAGFVRPLRYVFLTDGLLCQLSDEQIEAVFGHEVGHQRHRHLLLRILAMVAPLSLWLLVEQMVPHATVRLEAWLVHGGLGLQLPTGLLTLAAMGCYVLLVFGSYSRLLEAQADLFGCRTLGCESAVEPLANFVSALEKLAAAGGADRNAAGLQHASIARRVDFLNRVAQDPQYELCFHRRIRLLSTLLIGVVISPLVYRVLVG